jgi:uncharacterized phage protein (TIGR01671 family)
MTERYLFRGKLLEYEIESKKWIQEIFADYYSKKWSIGNFVQCADTAQIWEQTDNGKWTYLVDPATVGQCTGLRDRNGVLIFEGDVIKTRKFGKDDGKGHNFTQFNVFQVVFNEIASGFYLKNNTRRFGFNERIAKICEILGNIHDNPDLLEEDENC